MKIQISKDGAAGDIQIPSGEYMVSLSTESNMICLVGAGREIKVPATKRRSNSKSKMTTVQFYSGGGPTWSLVVNTPKQGEYVAFITLK